MLKSAVLRGKAFILRKEFWMNEKKYIRKLNIILAFYNNRKDN